MNFLPYRPPVHLLPHSSPSSSARAEQQEELHKYKQWLECVDMLEQDLKWLLQLSHHKFWCQVFMAS